LPTASAVPTPAVTPSPAPTIVPSTPAQSTPEPSVPPPTSGPPPTPAIPEVVLLTHDSFALSDSVIAAFQQQTGYTLKILRAGDAGAMVNQAILSKSHPLGDVLFGVDNTFLSRALDAGIFEPYVAAGLGGVPAEFQLDTQQHRVTPIDHGDVCVDVDGTVIPIQDGPSLAGLAKPGHKGQLVVENPATSSPGLAFMLATIAQFGESGNYTWLDYWHQLRVNDVQVSSSWDDAYDTQFSAGPGAGPRPMVVSYATDPAAQVDFANPPITKPSVYTLLDTCFSQVEFAGVLAGANNPAGAKAFVDFLLSPAAQEDIPGQMYVYPVVVSTPLPASFVWAIEPLGSLKVDPTAIEQNRERWIDQWTTTVLR
jgi:thiamine transport system substrate-binding protein